VYELDTDKGKKFHTKNPGRKTSAGFEKGQQKYEEALW
jgi:hypothetical protein